MNFNVYMNKKIGDRVKRVAKTLHRSRNSIINEAVEEWLEKRSLHSWPNNFFDFAPIDDVPDFKAFRNDLGHPPEDPLA